MKFIIWGIIMSIVGLFILISALITSNFKVYRLFEARSKVFWKSEEKVHKFYQVVGVLITLFGILVALEIIKNSALHIKKRRTILGIPKDVFAAL